MSESTPSRFDFEREMDRRSGDSLKWNRYAGRDVLPLWVADMDFAAPPAVLEALHQRVAQGCLGYSEPWPALVEAVVAHLYRHYGWQVAPEWLVWLPGLVTGLNLACRSIDGGVITATPVYPPFLSAPQLSGRALVRVPLHQAGGRWGFDFSTMDRAITPETRLLLLCHPHNPVGRAWSGDELVDLADFCKRHDLIVCSDEIHCDLILDENRPHRPLAMVSEEVATRCITLMAPSKTFNIPGLGCSFAVISEPRLRQRFCETMRGIVPDVNLLGLVAAEAAYRDGEPWRQAVIEVLRANRDLVQASLGDIPQLRLSPVEATYLAWIDARGLGVEDPVAFFEASGVGLSRGADFGLPGWVRLNFGCPRTLLVRALERMKLACSAIRS